MNDRSATAAKETPKCWTFDDLSRSNDDSRSRYKNRAVITEIGLLALLNIYSAQELINQSRLYENGPIDDGQQDIGENVLEADSFLCWWKAIKANGKLKSGRSSRQHQSRQRRLLSVVPSALIPPALAVSVCNPEALLLFLTVSFAYVDNTVDNIPRPS